MNFRIPETNRLLLALALTTALVFFSGVASAARYHTLQSMVGQRIEIDGMLQEWSAGSIHLKGPGDNRNSAFLGYDERYLYLAAKIEDDQVVRTARASRGEDKLSLRLFIPSVAGSGVERVVDVYPGNAKKKLAAVVKVNGRRASSTAAVEAPTDAGYNLEAKIPWTALTTKQSVRIGLRGRLAYSDVSPGGRSVTYQSASPSSGKSLPPLPLGAEAGLIEGLLLAKGLKLEAAREVYGDLTGRGGPERVALHGHFLSIVGPGYRGGSEFYYSELDIERADQVTALSLRDFDGDKKKEIVLQKRLGKPNDYRELVTVLRLDSAQTPQPIFVHELSIANERGQIRNKLQLSGEGAGARIKIAQGTSRGFEPGSYSEPTAGEGIPSALLPWQGVRSRTFAFRGDQIVQVDEDGSGQSASAPRRASSPSPQLRPAPPVPRAPTPEERLERVFALYLQDRKLKKGTRPSFDFVTDVAQDETAERVLVIGQDLLVFGKGFKKGLSYTYLTMGVRDPGDILAITARDLVGDGKAEILVHALLRAKSSKSLGGEVVQRQALFVYKVQGDKLKRIFAAETARSLGENRILSSVAFLPTSRGWDLELRPLRALGWTQASYPFPEDQHPAGGLEPLLLPWSVTASRHYHFDGQAYEKH